MKCVKIIRLVLENFKCHACLHLDLAGEDRSILGDNASGKTSIYDGLTWLLFGKDSSGSSDPETIKPLNAAGEVADHQAITLVEAELAVDGEPLVLRRAMREVWTTRRGSSEQVYGGNATDYMVNGVPMKKGAYDERVRQIMPEDLFRMLTSVSWFPAGIRWQERRNLLIDMAGSLTDQQIIAQEPRFRDLLDSLGPLSMADYKAKILAQKRSLSGTRDDIPARISECQKALEGLEKLDVAAARKKAEELEGQLNAARQELASMENNTAVKEQELALRVAEQELAELDRENRAYRREQESRQPDLRGLEMELADKRYRLDTVRRYQEGDRQWLQRLEESLQQCRDRWAEADREVYGGGVCPTCGQALPEEQRQQGARRFQIRKQEKLAAIEQEAKGHKVQMQALQERLDQESKEIASLEEAIGTAQEALDQARKATVTVEDLADYEDRAGEIRHKIQAAKEKIDRIRRGYATAAMGLQDTIQTLRGELAQANSIIAQEATAERTRARIGQLQEEARNAAQALEAVERMLVMMEEYTRFKTRFVEERINGLFKIARFRLFREQANGGLEDRCDVVVDGVPYAALNSGMKINVGIDIINTLSRHYGVTVPLFVDNAESVTCLEPSLAQVVRLVVSESDKEVRMV